jgi:ketosteroid isomerase-like protein
VLGYEMKSLAVALMLILTGASYAGAQSPAEKEEAIKALFTRFYEGWNVHDPDAMVSIYVADIDHINVWGEWNKAKEAVRKDLAAIHSASARNSQESSP